MKWWTQENQSHEDQAQILTTPLNYFVGKVVKISQGSINVVVLGLSSAFISDEDIREEFRHKNLSI